MDRSSMCRMLSGIADRLFIRFLNGVSINKRKPIDGVICSQLGTFFLCRGTDLSQDQEKCQRVTRAAA